MRETQRLIKIRDKMTLDYQLVFYAKVFLGFSLIFLQFSPQKSMKTIIICILSQEKRWPTN